MPYELYYTSAPRGLRQSGGGFCTVAETRGTPAPLARRLEQLGGYRPLFPPGVSGPDRNPVRRAHYRIEVGGRSRCVLTRVAPSGLDHTRRPNVLAYHLALNPDEQPVAGPAWALAQPGLMAEGWDGGEPRLLGAGRAIPAGDAPPGPCDHWAAAAGDAGWAGLVAEAALAGGRPVYLIVGPATDPLPLLAEAVALVPPRFRWHVTFSTYFHDLPAGAACGVRCVAAGTPAAADLARPDASPAAGLVVDLTRPAAAPARPAADRARAGVPIDHPAVGSPGTELEFAL